MLIDRLQSLIAVLITLTVVWLANSAPESHLSTYNSNEITDFKINNKSMNKYYQNRSDENPLKQTIRKLKDELYRTGENDTTLKSGIAQYSWLPDSQVYTYQECCPSEIVSFPRISGRNRQQLFVNLTGVTREPQEFYELQCKEDIVGKPCRFMSNDLYVHSECVQMFSFAPAYVQNNLDHQRQHRHQCKNKKRDYIQIRSGCGCMIKIPKEKPRKQRQKNVANDGGKKSQ